MRLMELGPITARRRWTLSKGVAWLRRGGRRSWTGTWPQWSTVWTSTTCARLIHGLDDIDDQVRDEMAGWAKERSELIGFWVAWHLAGGFRQLEAGGWHRATIFRKVRRFRTVFGSHPDEATFPWMRLDLRKALVRRGPAPTRRSTRRRPRLTPARSQPSHTHHRQVANQRVAATSRTKGQPSCPNPLFP